MVFASSSTESTLRVDLLLKFKTTAQQLKDLIGTSLEIPVSPSPSYNGPIPELVLPFPNDILIIIEGMDLPEHPRRQIKSKLTEKVFQSQRICIESYQRTCRELSGPLISFGYLSNLADTFRQFYDDHQMPKFRASILAAKSTLQMVNKGQSQDSKKPTFNSEYTPLLERYFEHNAYPSRPDRVLLARKSLMTERQIEVWFQNHRNRAKKEGIPLKRMSSHQPSPMEFLERKEAPLPILPKRAPSSSPSDIDMPDNHNGTVEAVAKQPSETFPITNPIPSTFPTHFRRDPTNSFLNPPPRQEGTSRFPLPSWPRKPVTKSPSPVSVNMEEFAAMFALKLNIRRGSSTKSNFGRGPWYSGTVTAPSPAPHPSLIRPKALPRPSTLPSSLPRTMTSSHSTWPNIFNSPFSSIPQSETTAAKASKPRKAPPFPFRTPQKVPSPSIATPPSASQAFAARTWSFASISSSDSRSSSASGGSPPGPTTPPHSPTTESYVTHEPVILESTSDDFDLFAGIIEPQIQNFSQNLDFFLSSDEDVFSNKYFSNLTHNFSHLDPLYAAS